MTRRPRKHIPMIEIAASALADKLTAEERHVYRDGRASAKEILRLFTPDHCVLYAWDGPDRWWNITMTRRGPALKAKDAADTSRAAKAKRIDEKWMAFMRALKKGHKPKPWRKASLRSVTRHGERGRRGKQHKGLMKSR